MADLRTGPGFRMRCPFDDGTTVHNAIEMHGGMPLDTFAKALQLFARCGCGRGMVMLKSGAPEPKDAPDEYAATRAADVPVKKGGRRGH